MELADLFNILHNAVEAQANGRKISHKKMAEELRVSMRTYQDWRLGKSKPQAARAVIQMLGKLEDEDIVRVVRKINRLSEQPWHNWLKKNAKTFSTFLPPFHRHEEKEDFLSLSFIIFTAWSKELGALFPKKEIKPRNNSTKSNFFYKFFYIEDIFKQIDYTVIRMEIIMPSTALPQGIWKQFYGGYNHE